MPPEWAGMDNLTALTLGETALSGTLPSQWSSLHNLSYFLAEATQLWGTVRSSLCLRLRHECPHSIMPCDQGWYLQQAVA